MDNLKALLQSTILAISQYNNHRGDRNVEALQKQIDVLISKTSQGHSLKFFCPGEVLPSECLTSLISLISESDTKHSLLRKCLMLFNNLVTDSTLCESLHEKFQLTPSLVVVIRNHGQPNNDTLTAEALRLLQRVTYGHHISFEEIYMRDLVKFLLAQITYPLTGLTKQSMGVLVNLTRNNISVQHFIKNYETMHEFSRRLTKLLGDDNQTVILFSLILLFSLCMQEKVAHKFFAGENTARTYQLVFNILIQREAGETRRYAVDLLKDLLKVEQHQRSLANFEYLGSCLEATLKLLNTSTPESVIKVFELLQTLCNVKAIKPVVCKNMIAAFPIKDKTQLTNVHQTPLNNINDPLLATMHWAGQSTDTHGLASLGAYDVLTELYEDFVFSQDKSHHEKHAAAVLPVIIHTLKCPLEGDNLAIKRKLQAMVKAVKLLKSLCNDEKLLVIISKRLDPKLVISLLEYQFENNTVPLLKSKDSWSTDDWSSAGVDLVLYLLHVIALTKNQDFEDFFFTIMQESQVVPFLVSGMSSGNRQQVYDTFSLISFSSRLEGFPGIQMCDALAAINGDRETKLSETPRPSLYPVCHSENKENSFHSSRFQHNSTSAMVLGESTKENSNVMETDVSAQSVQSLIEKINSDMKISDAKSTEIISVYQSALLGLQSKEQFLQDLLETKIQALNQADRLMAKYRARKGQDDAEASRVRTLLLSSERKCEVLEQDTSDLKTRLDQYVKELNELNQKYESLCTSHQVQTQELHSLTEIHEQLQKHNAGLKQQYNISQEENKKLAAQLKKTEEKLEETKSDYKRSEEERETMENCVDKLRSDMNKLDVKKKGLLEKVAQLESKVSQNEQQMAAYAEEVSELKGDLAKQRQIAALINSLSSGSDVTMPNTTKDDSA